MAKNMANFAKKGENLRENKNFLRYQMAPKFYLNMLFCFAVLK